MRCFCVTFASFFQRFPCFGLHVRIPAAAPVTTSIALCAAPLFSIFLCFLLHVRIPVATPVTVSITNALLFCSICFLFFCSTCLLFSPNQYYLGGSWGSYRQENRMVWHGVIGTLLPPMVRTWFPQYSHSVPQFDFEVEMIQSTP